MASRDFEDIVLLVDGREELAAEIAELPEETRSFVGDEIGRVMLRPSFDYGVEGALVGSGGRDRALAVTIPRLDALVTQAT